MMGKPKVWGKNKERILNKKLLVKYLDRKTQYIDGHWLYTGGSKTVDGYRRITIDYKPIGVHRLSAYIFLGLDISNSNSQANHKPECQYKECWNPEHIYIGTHEQNLQDYFKQGSHNSKKEFCKRGHKLGPPGRSGKRMCKICHAMTNKESSLRRKLKRNA